MLVEPNWGGVSHGLCDRVQVQSLGLRFGMSLNTNQVRRPPQDVLAIAVLLKEIIHVRSEEDAQL
jgi:hypothetical protein